VTIESTEYLRCKKNYVLHRREYIYTRGFLNTNIDYFYTNSTGFVTFDGDVVYFEVGVEFLLLYSLDGYCVSNDEEKICLYSYFLRHHEVLSVRY
jgi:hypothetical protein